MIEFSSRSERQLNKWKGSKVENANTAFQKFDEAAKTAASDQQGNSEKKLAMARALSVVFDLSGKTKEDVVRAGIAHRATVDRWLRGDNVPHPSQRDRLRAFLLVDSFGHDSVPNYMLIMDILENPKYRPVVGFLMENVVSREQAGRLFRVAKESENILTIEFMQFILGFSKN